MAAIAGLESESREAVVELKHLGENLGWQILRRRLRELKEEALRKLLRENDHYADVGYKHEYMAFVRYETEIADLFRRIREYEQENGKLD